MVMMMRRGSIMAVVMMMMVMVSSGDCSVGSIHIAQRRLLVAMMVMARAVD